MSTASFTKLKLSTSSLRLVMDYVRVRASHRLALRFRWHLAQYVDIITGFKIHSYSFRENYYYHENKLYSVS